MDLCSLTGLELLCCNLTCAMNCSEGTDLSHFLLFCLVVLPVSLVLLVVSREGLAKVVYSILFVATNCKAFKENNPRPSML